MRKWAKFGTCPTCGGDFQGYDVPEDQYDTWERDWDCCKCNQARARAKMMAKEIKKELSAWQRQTWR